MKPIAMTFSAAAIALAGCSTTATADQVVGFVTSIQNQYRTEIQQNVTPICYEVQTPIYGGQVRRGSIGDTLAGAVIGGAIGNQFGSGSGRDASTVIGAIIGAEIGSRGSQRGVVGYQSSVQCENRITNQQMNVFDGYRVFYRVNGTTHSFHTYEWYSVGDPIVVRRY
jgi:uncharacterized protein YcfJ